MVRRHKSASGPEIYCMTSRELKLMTERSRRFCHLIYGRDLGDRMFRHLPFTTAVEMASSFELATPVA